MSRSTPALLGAIGLLLVAGCGSSSGDGFADAVKPLPTATRLSPTPSPTTSLPPVTTTTITSATMFATPTGNIVCFLDTDVQCLTYKHTWTLPAAPSCDPHRYGDALYLGTTGAAVPACNRDVAVEGDPPRLAYGAALTYGAVTCASLRTGVTCSNATTGHGLSVSRESYRLF